MKLQPTAHSLRPSVPFPPSVRCAMLCCHGLSSATTSSGSKIQWHIPFPSTLHRYDYDGGGGGGVNYYLRHTILLRAADAATFFLCFSSSRIVQARLLLLLLLLLLPLPLLPVLLLSCAQCIPNDQSHWTPLRGCIVLWCGGLVVILLVTVVAINELTNKWARDVWNAHTISQ